jgi:SAM-dependent methyltransferase
MASRLTKGPGRVTAVAIRRRNDAWFPRYRPAHEVYLDFVREMVEPGTRVFHLGAGRDSLGVSGQLTASLLVSGDLSFDGLSKNPNRLRVVLDGEDLPFRSESYAVLVCEHVFEHLERPERVLAEGHRILQAGGALIFACPNRFSYIALAGSLTPHRFHVWFKRLISDTAEADTFRTYYRVNSRGRIRKLTAGAGFIVERLDSFVGWPTYWEFSEALHRLAVVAHWLLERAPRVFHISLVGILRKKAMPSERV